MRHRAPNPDLRGPSAREIHPENFRKWILLSCLTCFLLFGQPKIEDNIVRRFDEEVKDKTSSEVYDAYVQIVLENYHKNITIQEFKEKLGELL